MSRKIEHAELPGLTPDEFVDILNTGGQILNATLPLIKEGFNKIGELVNAIHIDNLSFPHGKKLAILELQRQVEILNAKDILQKQYNKLKDEADALRDADLKAIKAKLELA